MTPEQAFEKWWRVYCISPAEGYSSSEKEEHMQQAFLAGQQYQETNQLIVLADIRKAVGDGEGRLSQEELVKRIEGLVFSEREIRSVMTALLGCQIDLPFGFHAEIEQALKSVTTEKEEAS